MADVSVADAKARLSGLMDRACRGEAVLITRRGKPVARITSVTPARRPIDLTELRAVTEAMPKPAESARTWMRRQRAINATDAVPGQAHSSERADQ